MRTCNISPYLRAARSPVVNVVDASDGPVAVEWDGDQVEDGRRAAEHVERHPSVTQRGTSEGTHASHSGNIRWHPCVTQRTSEMATRWRMDDVQQSTSNDTQASHSGQHHETPMRHTAGNIRGHPCVTQRTSERPAASDVVDGGERHNERGDEQVGDGQRRDQVVGDVDAQVTLHSDRDHHKHVADNRRRRHQSQQQWRHPTGAPSRSVIIVAYSLASKRKHASLYR